MSMNDYGMDIGEQVISDTLKKVSEGEITFDDTENLYEDELTNDEGKPIIFRTEWLGYNLNYSWYF